MGFSPEIKLSRISAQIDSGDLTLSDLDTISENLADLIRSSCQKTSDAAKKIFESSMTYKSQRVQQDLSQIEKLAAITAEAQSLNAVMEEMDPADLEAKIADLAEDMHQLKEFFTPDLADDALKVQKKVESLEAEFVFPTLRDLKDYARVLLKKAEEIEGV